MVGRKIISLHKSVCDLCPIDILTGEIAVGVTGVVGVSPALWYFRYSEHIFDSTQAPVHRSRIYARVYFFVDDPGKL